MAIYLYILRCADGSYYTGTTRTSLDRRFAEHQAGTFDGYTSTRRPVELVCYRRDLRRTAGKGLASGEEGSAD